MRNFSIASANMGRRNHAQHVMLEMNTEDDIICVQEPWWGRIGTTRADGEKWGTDARGGAAHGKWYGEYPYTGADKRAKVMTYVRKHDRENSHRPHQLQVVARLDLAAHPCLLITDIRVGRERWRVVNFYNDVEDPSAMKALRELQLGDEIPTLLVGDFNTHSRTWSPLGLTPSTWAHALEEWAAANTLELLTIPGAPTRRGQLAQNQRDSTLDLAWRNFSAQVRGTFQGAMVDWPGSFGSDHALIRTLACTPYHVKGPGSDHTNRFDTELDQDGWTEWHRVMRELSPIVRGQLSTQGEVDTIIDLIYAAFNGACQATMKRKGSNPARSSRWWTGECKAASLALKEAQSDDTRQQADRNLKKLIHRAKRGWADKYITTANVWEVAAWRHSRRQTRIPALKGEESELIYNHEGMASILSKCFFTDQREDIPPSFPVDPPPPGLSPAQTYHRAGDVAAPYGSS